MNRAELVLKTAICACIFFRSLIITQGFWSLKLAQSVYSSSFRSANDCAWKLLKRRLVQISGKVKYPQNCETFSHDVIRWFEMRIPTTLIYPNFSFSSELGEFKPKITFWESWSHKTSRFSHISSLNPSVKLNLRGIWVQINPKWRGQNLRKFENSKNFSNLIKVNSYDYSWCTGYEK